MKRIAFALVFATACGATTPVWYESEPGKTSWTLPLLNPLDDAELIVPVYVNGEGPYQFVIDPEAPASMIDRGVAEAVGLYRGGYIRLINQRDVSTPRRTYEVLDLRAGDLHARKFGVAAAPAGTLRAAGRPIHGVLGPDLLSRTIVLDVDRDAGVVRLVLTGHERVPEGAAKVAAGLHQGTLRVAARANGARDVDLVVHVARRTTSLRSSIIDKLGLTLGTEQEVIVDATGDAVTVRGRARLASLQINGETVADVDVIPYLDKRERDDIKYQGTLGQNVLSRYRVVIDRDDKQVWLAPRAADLAAGTAARLRRWGPAFTRCRDTACTALSFDPATRALTATREANAPDSYRIAVQALDDTGAPVGALLYTELSAEQGTATIAEVATVADYARATSFRVVDATPAL